MWLRTASRSAYGSRFVRTTSSGLPGRSRLTSSAAAAVMPRIFSIRAMIGFVLPSSSSQRAIIVSRRSPESSSVTVSSVSMRWSSSLIRACSSSISCSAGIAAPSPFRASPGDALRLALLLRTEYVQRVLVVPGLAVRGERVAGGASLIGRECRIQVVRPGVITGEGHADAEDLSARVCGEHDRAVVTQAEFRAADNRQVPAVTRVVPVAAAQLRVGADDRADERLGGDRALPDVLQHLVGERRVRVPGAGQQPPGFGADLHRHADRHRVPLRRGALDGAAVVKQALDVLKAAALPVDLLEPHV